jgi:hypothetical protein
MHTLNDVTVKPIIDMRAYSMFIHLTLENHLLPLTSLDTVKVDLFSVQDLARVDGESNTLDLGGTLLGLALVLNSDLGLLRCQHGVVDLTLVVLSLSGSAAFRKTGI